jgi:hypothetical protein
VFREVYELWNTACSKAVLSSDLLTIDETQYPMYTKVSFK